jgi:dTDP-4-amino-4,6-dideoxygalactose transaminase
MGGVCDMQRIMRIARKHKLLVIEDAAQSCGATYRGKRAGAIGDIGCFSIAAYKIVGAGEGGLLLTKNKRMWERANQLAEGGGLWRPERFAPPRYDGELFCGANYRMTELEAAMDNVQLRRMPATVRRFNKIKLAILKRLKTFRQITPQKLNDPEGDAGYAIRFFPETIELAEKIATALKDLGINCNTRGKNAGPDWHLYSYMYPVILQQSPAGKECVYECPRYTARGGRAAYSKNCPIADDLFNRVVNINLNQWFSPQDCRHLADAINTVLANICTRNDTAKPWL